MTRRVALGQNVTDRTWVLFRVTGVRAGPFASNDGGTSAVAVATTLDGEPNHNLPVTEVFACGPGELIGDCTDNPDGRTYYSLAVPNSPGPSS